MHCRDLASPKKCDFNGIRMATRRFRDLQVWQRSMGLAREAYKMTSTFPRDERFGLTSQIRRCAVSVPSNIAEGRGRLTDKGFMVFLGQARGSLYELETQVELATEFGFVNSAQAQPILREAAEVGRMLEGLLGMLRR
jgi:four helix bundle protein